MICGMAYKMLVLWALIISVTALIGLAFSNILPFFSEIVDEDRQGLWH